jgi:hypothetical protein
MNQPRELEVPLPAVADTTPLFVEVPPPAVANTTPLFVDIVPIMPAPIITLKREPDSSPRNKHHRLANRLYATLRPTQRQRTPQQHPPRPYTRTQDFTTDFKRQFGKLLDKYYAARVDWDHFWHQQKCSGSRPCMKVFLAFCAGRSDEFSKLRREFAHRSPRLGTRTACKCMRYGPNL